jgi:acetyl esterase/lipase
MSHIRITTAFFAFVVSTASAQTPDFTDVAYATPDPAWKFDLSVPDAGCPPYPLVVFIHGGGWISGDKTDVEAFQPYFLNSGFAVASINYRYCFVHKWPKQIFDCKAAIRFLRANAPTYSIDPDRIGVFGISAGGQLAAVLGTSSGVESLEGNVGDHDDVSSIVHAVATYYPPTDLFEFAQHEGPDGLASKLIGIEILDVIENIDDPEFAEWVALINSASPMSHVTKDDPPFYLVHGDQDVIVPFEHSQWLHDALIAGGVTSTFDLLPGFGHTDIPTEQAESVAGFFVDVLGTNAPIVGDLDQDCIVGPEDIAALLAQWGECPKAGQCTGDLAPPGGNGKVSAADLAALLANWTGPQ